MDNELECGLAKGIASGLTKFIKSMFLKKATSFLLSSTGNVHMYIQCSLFNNFFYCIVLVSFTFYRNMHRDSIFREEHGLLYSVCKVQRYDFYI